MPKMHPQEDLNTIDRIIHTKNKLQNTINAVAIHKMFSSL